MVSPSRRRDAVLFLVKRHQVSERRACKVVGQHRSTNRYERKSSDFEQRLVKRIYELVDQWPSEGYEKICQRLRWEGWKVNPKRVHRLWKREGLSHAPAKRSGKRAEGLAGNSVWKLPAEHPDHVWAYDFVSDRTRDGRPIRILNIVDEFTRETVATAVERNIGSGRVQRILEELFQQGRRPGILRSDNGREFIADSLVEWLAQQGVQTAFIEKGRPTQNGYVERFNGLMRRYVLNNEEFHSLLEARVVISEWVRKYNTERPHGALGGVPPTEYRKRWREAAAGK